MREGEKKVDRNRFEKEDAASYTFQPMAHEIRELLKPHW